MKQTGEEANSEQAHAQNMRFYDEEARRYDTLRYASPAGRRLDAFHKNLLKRVLFERLRPGDRVLELGCGTGRLLHYFADGSRRFVGVDASEGMLAVASARQAGRADLIRGDALALPFADGVLDAAYAILVLNLVPHFPEAVAELGRVLRRGGILAFNVPNFASLYFPAGLYVNLRGRTVRRNAAGYRRSHWFTRSEVSRVLALAGMTLLEIWGQPAHAALVDAVPPMRAEGAAAWWCKSLYFVARKDKD